MFTRTASITRVADINDRLMFLVVFAEGGEEAFVRTYRSVETAQMERNLWLSGKSHVPLKSVA